MCIRDRIWDKKKTTGYPCVLYYNANGDTSNNNPKYRLIERIGMAVSNAVSYTHLDVYKRQSKKLSKQFIKANRLLSIPAKTTKTHASPKRMPFLSKKG